MLRRIAVSGRSMEPTLREGDWLLALPLRSAPRVGDLVVARDPREPARLLVKRVAALAADRCVLAGDRPEASTDSRHFGAVPVANLVARPVFRYAPPSRFGRLGIKAEL